MTKFKQSYHSYPIEWLDSVDSTNSEVRRRMASLDNLSIIAARYQTAGRGQGSHTWLSAENLNLTFTLFLRMKEASTLPLDANDAVRIIQMATLSVHDFLASEGISSRIKWPNDIWVGDRKICGMLIENILEGGKVACSIIGIGLNLNQKEFDPALPNPVSLSQLSGKSYDPDSTLERLYEHICRRTALLGTSDGRSELENEFNSYLFHLERNKQEVLSEAIESFEAKRPPRKDPRP
ncbi:MAG: biotin--[acetyl-CoA-carboxylase] ligase [Bacteroidales bacterium]|nr:biotin--[acetyl-CoA-carboxylase] ligase [Bacteroidales bacterium]